MNVHFLSLADVLDSTPSNMDKLVVDDWAQFRTVGDVIYQPLPERPHAEPGAKLPMFDV